VVVQEADLAPVQPRDAFGQGRAGVGQREEEELHRPTE
jgi:hypothetical protein